MLHKKFHLQESTIPDGMRIFEDRLEVAGTGFRRDDAINYCLERDQSLDLVPDPGNRHDRNAIEVIGYSKGWVFAKRRHLGYVPKGVSKQIAASGLIHQLRARLLKTYVGNDDYVEILFQILGPSDRFEDYQLAGKKPSRRKTTA